MTTDKRPDSLSWFEILTVTLIMFGPGIWISSAFYLEAPSAVDGTAANFSSQQNVWAGVFQSLQLLTVFFFLYLREWRFSNFRFRPSVADTIKGLGLFVFTALLVDIGFSTALLWMPDVVGTDEQVLIDPLARIHPSLVFYSMLNGFYEEFFFLTLVSAAAKRNAVFLFSLFVRFSFHTYQGLLTAVLIGLILGVVNYYFFTKAKDNNLYPFFFAHALADVFGLSLLGYFALE